MQRLWRGAAYWLAHHGLLIEPGTTIPGMALPTVGWSLPYQSLSKKMPSNQMYGGIFSVEIAFFQISLVCVQLTYTSQHNCLIVRKALLEHRNYKTPILVNFYHANKYWQIEQQTYLF